MYGHDKAVHDGFTSRIVAVSAFDGGVLRGTLFGRPDGRESNGETRPLLCLPGHTRNSRDFHRLAECLLQRDDGPKQILALDHRGRGLSDARSDWRTYGSLAETEDVISVCDALGWHHVDVIANSRGGFICMLLAALRPGLQARVVLNDIGPEMDGVGVARMKTAVERMPLPPSWNDAAGQLKEMRGKKFPVLTDSDWADRARATWKDVNGKPALDYDSGLIRQFQSLDVDQRLPTFWRQFNGLKRVPLLLIEAEFSDILSKETADRMHREHPLLTRVEAYGQGHAPVLHLGGLPEAIGEFLAKDDQASALSLGA